MIAAGFVDALGAPAQKKKKKKKRKSSSTYNSRTLAECRKRGWVAQGVEQTIKIPGGRTFKRDLFGVIDVVAIDLSAPLGQRTIGIQTTSGGTGGSHAPHRDKILAEPRASSWLQAGNRLELWSWAKQGARGKAKRWTLRVETFSAADWRTPFAGVDRTAAVESLQHVAEPMPALEAVKQGIAKIARVEAADLPVELLPDALALHYQRKPRIA